MRVVYSRITHNVFLMIKKCFFEIRDLEEFLEHPVYIFVSLDGRDRIDYLDDVADTTESLPDAPEPWLPTEESLDVLPLMFNRTISEQLLSLRSLSNCFPL